MAQAAAPAGRDVIPDALLRAVPGCADGAAGVRIEPLAAGTRNRAWRVDGPRGAFVLRANASAASDRALGVDRSLELQIHAAAARAGLAPRIVAADVVAGYLVTEFVDGAPLRESDLHDDATRSRIGLLLRELHALPKPAPVPAARPLLASVREHARAIASEFPLEADDAARAVESAHALSAAMGGAARPPAVVHGDLHRGNMVDAGRLLLIDFEYATVADPLRDLAALLSLEPALAAHRAELLERSGLGAHATLVELDAATGLYHILNRLWLRRQQCSCGNRSGNSGTAPAN
jgi:aminoglycoside phosphotransferase (APT) family kinase protein